VTQPRWGNQQESKRDFSGMGARVLRVLLVVLAAIQLGQAADSFTSYGHDQSELAAWHAAAAVGLLTGAARPRLIDHLMPVMAGAAGVTVVVSVRDLVAARTTAGDELAHLFGVVGFLVLTMLWTLQDTDTSSAPGVDGGRVTIDRLPDLGGHGRGRYDEGSAAAQRTGAHLRAEQPGTYPARRGPQGHGGRAS
jgi:hypothetical protein